MTVSDIMSKNIIFTNPDTSLSEAKAIMNREKISKLPVLDKNNNLVGIVTKNDLNKAGPSEATTLDIYEIGYLLSKIKVQKVMTKDVISVDSSEVIEEAARIMADKEIGCLPVLKNGALAGIVTESDIFRQFIDMFGARHDGVRIAIEVSDKSGELEKITNSIAKLGGNIVSLVTSNGSNVSTKKCTIKIANIEKDSVEKALKELNATIIDIRIQNR